VGHNVVEILSRAFYALQDTKTPVLVGVGAMSLNVIFSFAFSALFTRIGWLPHGGLALANSFATALEMTALFVLMRRRLKGLEGGNIWQGFAQAALGSVLMSLVVIFWSQIQGSVWVLALGGVALGGGFYAVALWVMKVPEVAGLMNWITHRIKPLINIQ
jgi:putative peptidoglycan lipid II flippase